MQFSFKNTTERGPIVRGDGGKTDFRMVAMTAFIFQVLGVPCQGPHAFELFFCDNGLRVSLHCTLILPTYHAFSCDLYFLIMHI